MRAHGRPLSDASGGVAGLGVSTSRHPVTGPSHLPAVHGDGEGVEAVVDEDDDMTGATAGAQTALSSVSPWRLEQHSRLTASGAVGQPFVSAVGPMPVLDRRDGSVSGEAGLLRGPGSRGGLGAGGDGRKGAGGRDWDTGAESSASSRANDAVVERLLQPGWPLVSRSERVHQHDMAYMAPEVLTLWQSGRLEPTLEDEEMWKRADVFALGCLLVFLCTGEHPTVTEASAASGFPARFSAISLSKRDVGLPDYSTRLDLLAKLTATNPADRPTIQQVLAHQFFGVMEHDEHGGSAASSVISLGGPLASPSSSTALVSVATLSTLTSGDAAPVPPLDTHIAPTTGGGGGPSGGGGKPSLLPGGALAGSGAGSKAAAPLPLHPHALAVA